jgi:glycosyltransferase involved in cell wall biosynthesis
MFQRFLSQRRRLARLFKPDVILIQMARLPDNVPQPFAPIPAVFDIDDADFQDETQLPRILANMAGCTRIIAGSRYIATWCRQHHPAVDVIWTGTDVRPAPVRSQRDRASIVGWAAGDPVGYPSEAGFVMEIMARVSARRDDIAFRLYADDGSDAYKALVDRFRAAGIATETRPPMAYDAFLQSLEEVAIGLNPLINMDGFSAGKSFGKVLAYLDAGVPTINTPNVDHPLFFDHGRNGFLAGQDADQWADLILAMIDDAPKRQQVAEAARTNLVERLSLVAAGRRVDDTLRSAIAAANGTA